MAMSDYVNHVMLALFSLFLSIIIPSIHYLAMKRKTVVCPSGNSFTALPKVTIILPMRNEEPNVSRKIKEIFSFNYPKELLRILIVESCSSDDTARIAAEMIGNNGDVHSLNQPGKSRAVNYAIDLVETDFFFLLDADANCGVNTILDALKWFEDEKIGAVCGRQCDSFSKFDPYRTRFNTIRTGESAVNSTPILEGSLCCFRKTAIGDNRLDPRINADDTQLSMIVRRNGYRAIMDPNLKFSEDYKISRRRKVRRAQGISRALMMNKDMCFGYGKFSAILTSNIFFYVFMPWIILCSGIVLLNDFLTPWDKMIGNIRHITAIMVIFLVTIAVKFVREFLIGISILIESHVRLIFGNSLEIWIPDR